MTTKLLFSDTQSAFSQLNRMLKGKAYKYARFFILVDENSFAHCFPTFMASVPALERVDFFEVPVGEEAKSIEIATQLWQSLLEAGADRRSVVINLGGGCVSDLGGFVAAGFKRGIRYINVPTTLVGMVDAAIGGKTAVNLGSSKNQVGFFHHPEAVVFYPKFFDTTTDEQKISGCFEVLKTFLLSDAAWLKSFEQFLSASLVNDEEKLWELVVRRCAEFKSDVVKADPSERSVRKILNLGHTFGHGYESFRMATGKPVPHGVAVGIGLLCELYLSVKKVGLSDQVLADYVKATKSLVKVPRITLKDSEGILSFMRQDKKNRGGQILCTLLQDVGTPVIDVAIDDNEVRDALLHAHKL
ncbi:MAG: 3-dehydroquinate synthase [Bacteroidales bacterium]|nr:3-dehydroquinate synthase [Bacteroidales bacterium]